MHLAQLKSKLFQSNLRAAVDSSALMRLLLLLCINTPSFAFKPPISRLFYFMHLALKTRIRSNFQQSISSYTAWSEKHRNHFGHVHHVPLNQHKPIVENYGNLIVLDYNMRRTNSWMTSEDLNLAAGKSKRPSKRETIRNARASLRLQFRK